MSVAISNQIPVPLRGSRCDGLAGEGATKGGDGGTGGGLNTTAPGYFGLTSDMVQVSDPGSGTNDYRLTVFITNYPYTVLSPYIGGTHIGPNITVSYPIGQ